MGKITSIYLTDGEAKQLEKFCEENQCTQYSALKAALRELLIKPVIKIEESNPTSEEDNTRVSEPLEETKKTEESKSSLPQLLKALSKE